MKNKDIPNYLIGAIKAVDYLVNEGTEDLCGHCAFYDAETDHEVCECFNRDHYTACRNGVIEFFRGAKNEEK